MTQQVANGVFTSQTQRQLLLGDNVVISASGAIDPHAAQKYVITKAGVAAMTLAAPTAGTDDGLRIQIASETAYAHTVTATGLFQDGSGNVNEATFAAHAGALLELEAYNGKWQIKAELGITMS